MGKAARIMKKKKFIKDEMDRLLEKEISDAVWLGAERRLDAILKEYSSLPKGVRTHTDTFIFPAAAVYLSVKDIAGQQTAYQIIENASVRSCAGMNSRLKKMMKLPGMPDLFVRMWDPITKKMFSENSGFKNRFYLEKKGEYRMDILACPYCRYFNELGCPELTKIFCDNDERTYGNLPGLEFIRTSTLGKGGECCDFLVRRV